MLKKKYVLCEVMCVSVVVIMYIICFVQEIDVESIKAPQVRTLLQFFKRVGAQEPISESPVTSVHVAKKRQKKTVTSSYYSSHYMGQAKKRFEQATSS